MKKYTLFFSLLILFVQSLCSAQGINTIDWEFRAKGDTVAISDVGFGPLYDTLLFRKGVAIYKNDDKSIRFLSSSLRIGTDIPSNTIFTFKDNVLNPGYVHARVFRNQNISKKDFICKDYGQYLINIFISKESSILFNQTANHIRLHGWQLKNPQVKYNLEFITLRRIPNVRVLSNYKLIDEKTNNAQSKFVSIGNIKSDSNAIPYFTDYSISQNNSEQFAKSVELPPQTSRAFEPIAHSFQDHHQNHILLFGNIKDSTFDRNGYDIVVVDTTLSEVKRVRIDSTQINSTSGIIYPTNLFTVNDKIFVTGFIDYGNMQYPFYSEHTSNGEFVKSQIVNTNATIHSGSVSPDGKMVMMCGSILNANDNSDFFVVAINTETGSSTQKTWGDSRVNELFDILAISNDTAYVTGSEDKDFYAGRLINVQTMSVSETNDFEKNIQVTPNPASNTISISVQNLRPIQSKLTIQNMQGTTVATVFEGTPSTTEVQNVSIERLPIGAYFITMENGNSTYRTKFIVKK